MSIVSGRFTWRRDALESENILYRSVDFLLNRKAVLFSHLKSRSQDPSASSVRRAPGARRHSHGQWRVFYYIEDRQLAYFPASWTNTGEGDPFVLLSGGQAVRWPRLYALFWRICFTNGFMHTGEDPTRDPVAIKPTRRAVQMRGNEAFSLRGSM